jgi:hypothetical protein
MNEIPPDAVLHDHLPDGTILGPMPFHDGAAMAALLAERMAPEVFTALVERLSPRIAELRDA